MRYSVSHNLSPLVSTSEVCDPDIMCVDLLLRAIRGQSSRHTDYGLKQDIEGTKEFL